MIKVSLVTDLFFFYTPAKYIMILMSVCSFVHSSVSPSPSLIRYSSKTAEQNFMKLSGIVHYMMPYCTSYFKFYPHDFGVSQSKTRTLPLQHVGGPIFNPLHITKHGLCKGTCRMTGLPYSHLLFINLFTEIHHPYRFYRLHDDIPHILFYILI